MKTKSLFALLIKVLLCTLMVFGNHFIAYSQTVTFTCTGNAGSYKSGSVNSGGVIHDANMTNLYSIGNRGWASFDISSIPLGSPIISATLNFTTYNSSTSVGSDYCCGFTGNPATMSSTALYTACGSGRQWNNTSWTPNAANAKLVSSAGLSFISANLGGTLNVGYVHNSGPIYHVYGYNSIAPPTLSITYGSLSPCAGTPNPGNTFASSTIACPNTSVTFSLQNSSFVSTELYQWYKNGTAIAGATNVTYQTTITASGSYNCLVTCTSSGLSAYSTPLSVQVNNLLNCICNPYPTYDVNEEITNVTIGTLNNSSTCGTLAPGPGSIVSTYSNYKSGVGAPVPPILSPGFSYPFSFTQTSCNAMYSNQFYCWIDFNGDGDFLDAGENVYEGTPAIGNHTDVGYITIPNSGAIGLKTMRVMNIENSVPNLCQNFLYREVEDYSIQLIYNEVCIFGPPNFGPTVGPSIVCPNVVFNLNLQNSPGGTSPILSYLWQSADDLAFTINVNNIGTSYTVSTSQTSSKYYRCITTCNGFNTSHISTPLFVNTNSIFNCYCSSIASTTGDEEIYQVTLNGASTNAAYAGANACTTAAPGNGSVLKRYSNFIPLGNLTTLTKGQSYPFTIVEGECDGAPYFDFGTAIWIDFNHNNSFNDAGEKVFVESNIAYGPRNVTGLITIPIGATTGQTVMRVIVAEGYSGNTLTPCLQYGYGETEDYIINLQPPNSTLNLSLFMQGYWDGNSQMQAVLANQGQATTPGACDTIDVELRNDMTYTLASSVHVVVGQNGQATCVFPSMSGNFYIVVKGRNIIDTWSANPIALTPGGTSTYNFTTAANKSYGSNQLQVSPGVWAFYSGDFNADENIDLLDAALLENGIHSFQFGYYATDINGDGNVDLLDSPIVENNISNFIFSVHP